MMSEMPGRKLKYICLLAGILSVAACFPVMGQDSTQFSSGPVDSSNIIHLINADVLMGIQPGKTDSAQLQKLIGNVLLRQGQTFFSCDSALQNLTTNIIDAYGHIHINQADTINTYADFLHYEGNTKVATLRQNVRMTDSQMTLTTNLLDYNMDTHIGSYLQGGKLVNKTTILTSERGYYYADTKDVYFKTNVQLVDPEYTLATDTLLYNTNTRIATFQAPTTINTGKSIIHTTCGYYSTVENYAHLCDRSMIIDSSRQLTADSMNYSKNTGIGIAYGNVVWTDTAHHMTLLANYAVSNQNKKTVLATQKPLLILAREKDTLYTAADTLFSGVLPPRTSRNIPQTPTIDTTSAIVNSLEKKNAEDIKPVDSIANAKTASNSDTLQTDSISNSVNITMPAISDSSKETNTVHTPGAAKIVSQKDSLSAASDTTELRYIIAYHHVKLFSDSLQGVADSLYYSDLDSAFRFYKNPVLWTGQTQLTGDTIVLFSKNQQADRLMLQQHAMIINQPAPKVYNQIKGNVIIGYFKQANELDWMSVDGNAECLYYAQDDNGAFVGVNHSTSGGIHIYFKDNKLYQVVPFNDVDGSFAPPTKIPVDERTLKGFRWEKDRRPKSKAELME